MRVHQMLLLSAVLLAPAPLRAGCTRDTTAHEARTLFDGLHLKALHFDEGGGRARVANDREDVLEVKLAAALCRWPLYTISYVFAGTMQSVRTDYVVPGSDGFHPSLIVTTSGIEVARRWRDSSIFHPLVSFAAGSMRAEYNYSHREADGRWLTHTDGTSTAPYYMPAVGLEASVFKYMTVYYVLGSRYTMLSGTPGLERGALNGMYSVFGFGLGKFR